MRSVSMLIALLVLHSSFAARMRDELELEHTDVLNVDARAEVFIDAFHAQGLEHEHSFEIVSKRSNASTNNKWLATETDEATIGEILSILNPPGADAPWTWTNDNDHWTFGLVQITAGTAKVSLALHMLHRHGLAPLLAARAGQSFESFFKKRVKPSNMSSLQFFVQSEEEFEEVKSIRALLESLTLSGLRSLHSFDHQWSVNNFAYKVEGCSQRNAESCILQAGVSATGHNFLKNHGFLSQDAWEVESDFEKLMEGIGDTLDMGVYQNFLTPDHTGNKTMGLKLVKKDGFFGSAFYLEGNVKWEDGGLSSNIKTKVSTKDATKIMSSNETQKSEYIEAAFEKHVRILTGGHKRFMKQNRLKIWTHEEVEFTQMFERLPK